MNNHQRGIYQPLADKVPLYDLSDEETEEERSRVPLLIVIALIVLAAFAGVVWLAYNQGIARGRVGTSIVIAAPEGPVRVAPTDSGAETPLTGLKVYNDPVPPEQEAQTSKLAPQAPAAKTGPPPVRLNPAPAPAPARPSAPAAAPASPPAQAPQVANLRPQAPTTATPPAATPAPSAANRALSGAAVLQIGAYESVEIANGAWAAFRSRYDSAGTLAPDVQRVDLGQKGIMYRLRVGPFADRAAAVDACTKLKAAGANCFVTAP